MLFKNQMLCSSILSENYCGVRSCVCMCAHEGKLGREKVQEAGRKGEWEGSSTKNRKYRETTFNKEF